MCIQPLGYHDNDKAEYYKHEFSAKVTRICVAGAFVIKLRISSAIMRNTGSMCVDLPNLDSSGFKQLYDFPHLSFPSTYTAILSDSRCMQNLPTCLAVFR